MKSKATKSKKKFLKTIPIASIKTKRYNFEIQLNYSHNSIVESSNIMRDRDWHEVMDLFKNHPLIKNILYVPELEFEDSRNLTNINGAITMEGGKSNPDKDYWNGYLQVSALCWDELQRDTLLALIDNATLNNINPQEVWARYCVEDFELQKKCPACDKLSPYDAVACIECSWKLSEPYIKKN